MRNRTSTRAVLSLSALLCACAAPAAPAAPALAGAGGGLAATIAADVTMSIGAAAAGAAIGESLRDEFDDPSDEEVDELCRAERDLCLDSLHHVPDHVRGNDRGVEVCAVCHKLCVRQRAWPHVPTVCRYWLWQIIYEEVQ